MKSLTLWLGGRELLQPGSLWKIYFWHNASSVLLHWCAKCLHEDSLVIIASIKTLLCLTSSRLFQRYSYFQKTRDVLQKCCALRLGNECELRVAAHLPVFGVMGFIFPSLTTVKCTKRVFIRCPDVTGPFVGLRAKLGKMAHCQAHPFPVVSVVTSSKSPSQAS